MSNIPDESYGVLLQHVANSPLDAVVEQVRNLGFAVVESGFEPAEITAISEDFDATSSRYIETHGENELRLANEFYTVRAPLTHGGSAFLKLVLNANLQTVLRQLICGRFILNQQNGVISPPVASHHKAKWHRDLPYQHFVSTQPLAINALFCVDDFTTENGATFVLPASHLSGEFPSSQYVEKHAMQIEAAAGSFIVLDGMTFHAGGGNRTDKPRRAVNHLFSIPYFRQQINLPKNMQSDDLTAAARQMLGYGDTESSSICEYLTSRRAKNC